MRLCSLISAKLNWVAATTRTRRASDRGTCICCRRDDEMTKEAMSESSRGVECLYSLILFASIGFIFFKAFETSHMDTPPPNLQRQPPAAADETVRRQGRHENQQIVPALRDGQRLDGRARHRRPQHARPQQVVVA